MTPSPPTRSSAQSLLNSQAYTKQFCAALRRDKQLTQPTRYYGREDHGECGAVEMKKRPIWKNFKVAPLLHVARRRRVWRDITTRGSFHILRPSGFWHRFEGYSNLWVNPQSSPFWAIYSHSPPKPYPTQLGVCPFGSIHLVSLFIFGVDVSVFISDVIYLCLKCLVPEDSLPIYIRMILPYHLHLELLVWRFFMLDVFSFRWRYTHCGFLFCKLSGKPPSA